MLITVRGQICSGSWCGVGDFVHEEYPQHGLRAVPITTQRWDLCLDVSVFQYKMGKVPATEM